jgi:hypothetical protein
MTAEKAMGEVVSKLVIAWARIAEQALRNGFQLWKVPIELAEAEDATLGVWRTSVYFTAKPQTAVCLRCVSVKEMPSGRLITAAPSLDPISYNADGSPHEIEVGLPRNAGAGLYEITLEDETSRAKQCYLLPLGVPGRRR